MQLLSKFLAVLTTVLAGGGIHARGADASTQPVSSMTRWSTLPALPADAPQMVALAGVDRGVLIVAGGTGVDGLPSNRVFCLEPGKAWRVLEEPLHSPIASGASASTPEGVYCLDRATGTAFVLRFDLSGTVRRTDLPPLPASSERAAATAVGSRVYIATTGALYTIDLAAAAPSWKALASPPGASRVGASLGRIDGSLLLIGGLADGEPSAATDRYLIAKDQWQPAAPLPEPLVAAASTAILLSPVTMVLPAGESLWLYHGVTNTWSNFAATARSFGATDHVVVFDGKPTLLRGAGVELSVLSVERPKAAFGWANMASLAMYPIIMLLIGLWCARKKKSADDFFRGGQQIPWWAAGLSIYATMLSSLTFMAVPAQVYLTNWAWFINYAAILALAPVVVYIYLPFFRQLNVTSAYEYLELRFNLAVRLFGSASFIVFQIARTGIVLYLPALALSTVSDINMLWCIVGMTVLSVLLTVYGGMEAVVWTDVAQTVILLGAVIASLIVVTMRIGGGVPEVLSIGHADGKFFENLSWSPSTFTAATGWVLMIGFAFNNLISYTSNQEVVQRYTTTRDTKAAAKAIWTNALFSLPSGIIFFSLGTALYVFYKQQPERMDPTIRNDAIFPLFMLRELPAGIAGFVVAGIFAAAQPTSGLNSTATAVVVDFYSRLSRGPVTDRGRLLVGRYATVITGILGMSVAVWATRNDIRSIWETFTNMLGLTTGILAGLFTLGMLTRRANGQGATIGMVIAVITVMCVAIYSPIHSLLWGAIGVVVSFSAGFVMSLFFPAPSVEGLTVYTLRPRDASTT